MLAMVDRDATRWKRHYNTTCGDVGRLVRSVRPVVRNEAGFASRDADMQDTSVGNWAVLMEKACFVGG